MKKFKVLLSIATAVGLLASCSSDDDNRSVTGPGQDGGVTNENEIKGNISSATTLTSDNVYTITGPVTVKDGVTLTIEAGTRIEVEAGRTDTFLAVERGAKLIAVGTASSPIVFTSASGNPREGDWGGIVIAGNAPSNKGTDVQSEVAGLFYGGTAVDDNSGKLDYIIAEYTGAKINGEQEFNGISFFGVGDKTEVSNIIVRNGADDGIEFFGGSVNVTNVFCQNIADDMFDWTGGYTGTLTNAFGVRNAGFNTATDDPRGIEGDSNSNDATAAPVSTPTLNNVTILNLNTTVALKAGAEIRRGTVAEINNILFAAADGASFGNRIDTKDDSGNGSVTLTEAKAQGEVGDDKEGGSITGTIENITDGITITVTDDATTVTSKAGIGADLSAFDWASIKF